jgi:hypothetical protein
MEVLMLQLIFILFLLLLMPKLILKLYFIKRDVILINSATAYESA